MVNFLWGKELIDWHFSMNRKGSSPTQPGWGIQKIVDLFHELSNLADRAGKYCASDLAPEMDFFDCQDFEGMTEEAIDEERKEYVIWSMHM
jgi:hypothetical protein